MSLTVIKLGSSVVADDAGALRHDGLAAICATIAERHALGERIVVVSSGAIARGIQTLRLPERPSAIDQLQAASAVGQGRLFREWDDLLAGGDDVPEDRLDARAATVQSRAEELPLPVAGEQVYPEDIRLKYRFLDLRRETLHRNIVARTKITAEMSTRMAEAGFTEYSTPILTASSPGGARDFLVPSRLHEGKFYAFLRAGLKTRLTTPRPGPGCGTACA